MCRHLAHVGPSPITLASVVTAPPHSLLVQSYAPADMRGGGTVNADGFGVGFAPVRTGDRGDDRNHARALYRNDRPLWTDATFLDMAHAVESTAILAAVRSATVGMPVSIPACAPFLDRASGLLFSHNGVVRGWPDSMAALAGTLPPLALLELEAVTDSALLWALLRSRVAAGEELVDAVRRLVGDVLDAAPASRLNLLLVDPHPDGDRVIATAVDHALSVRAGADGSVTVASEPLDDDPAWTAVPDGSLLVAHQDVPGSRPREPAVEITPLSPPSRSP